MMIRKYAMLAALVLSAGTLSAPSLADHGEDWGDRTGDEDEGLLDLDFQQPRTVWTIQYLAAGGDYEKGVGLGLYHYPGDDRWGFFGNFQVGTHQGEPYYENLDINSFNDPVRGRYQDPVIINVGVTRSFGPIGIFAGGGYGGSSGVARKYDPMHILADDGEYFTPDSQLDESGVNFTAGATAELGRVSFDVGYNTASTSFYMGVGSTF